ncbi:hypothetical protein FRX31_006794 [Thalictrum thalictroides]|uniref:Uncharacterized protein n=1 Tax=Thalictrum thalictroides TaxID=46969 RepID=A0A7J6X1K8_THATH|nr:hypothetical protein FRX31_006794 [Thalictrum thalictroides]
MVDVKLGLSKHIQNCKVVFSLIHNKDDFYNIEEITKDCGDEYRRTEHYIKRSSKVKQTMEEIFDKRI